MISIPRTIKKILWIRPDAIGDSVIACSMLPAIKKHFSHAEIVAACQHHVGELYCTSPMVSQVIEFNKTKFMVDASYRAEMLSLLRLHNFDLVLNAVYSRELVFDQMATKVNAQWSVAFKITQRRGRFDFPFRYNCGYTHLVDSPGINKLELDRYKDFLRVLGIEGNVLQPYVWLTEKETSFANSLFSTYQLKPKSTIAFFAGAQSEHRVYEQYRAALVTVLPSTYAIVVLGADKDDQINRRVLDGVPFQIINLCGKTSLLEAAAVIKKCRLAVGAETGLAHVACAVGTKNVVVMGGGHWGRFMPYSSLSRVVASPMPCYGCDWRCHYNVARCVAAVDSHILADAIRDALCADQTSTTPKVFTNNGIKEYLI